MKGQFREKLKLLNIVNAIDTAHSQMGTLITEKTNRSLESSITDELAKELQDDAHYLEKKRSELGKILIDIIDTFL